MTEGVDYHYGIVDGVHTAINKEAWLRCPICFGGETMADCVTCKGRGLVDNIPYCDRPWDEVYPNLWVGGHFTARGPTDGTDCQVASRPPFDLIVSLAFLPGEHWRPPASVQHVAYRIADADLDPEHHTHLDRLADGVVEALELGSRVLVRCQGGINRSALVAGLAMKKMGVDPDEAIGHMREVRSPFVLFNESFVEYLRRTDG